MAEKINWYRSALDRNFVKELNQRSDAKGLLQSVSFLALFIVSIYVPYYFFVRGMWIPMIVTAYLHCMFHGFVGMESAVHELSHGTPFKTKWLNEFFYLLFSFLTWNSYVHFRVSHMKHHQYTVHQGLDKEVVLEPIPLNFWDFFSWLTFDYKKFKMIMFPNIAHFFGKADVDVFNWDPLMPGDDKRRREMCNWARIMVIGHLILLGLFIYYQLWILIPIVTFGYFFATFPSRGCVIQQHLGLCSNVPDWRVTCHTMDFGPLMQYFYWHMNYHIEHHMWAAVPFHNLRKLHKAIAYDTPEPPKGYIAGFKRIMTIRKRQRKDPNYCFVAEFPATAAPANMPSQ